MERHEGNHVLTDQEVSKLVMVRGDKTMLEMMREKPSGRWDPEYWAADYEELLGEMAARFETCPLGDYITYITYGQVGRRIYSASGDVQYIQTINLADTGIDYEVKRARIDEGSHNDLKRSRLQFEDLLLGNAGMGGLGKCVVFLDRGEKVNVSQDIDVIRIEALNTYYVAVFLKCTYGNTQIWRRSRGVGAPKLPFDEIKAILIPLIPVPVQQHVESQYKRMCAYHDKAMEAKKKGNESEYRKNIQIAEKMLNDLVARIEAVIRGEHDDVI